MCGGDVDLALSFLVEPEIPSGLLRCQSVLALRQQPPNKVPQLLAVVRLGFQPEGKLSFEYAFHRLQVILLLKRRHPAYHPVQSDPQRPHIDHLVIPSTFEHLRCSVVRGACDGEHIFADAPTHDLLADAEVDQFDGVGL